ncbi:MAG: hypothetical protein A3K10_11525 [Bacteroidetes bacterium RIFCSPLOWO2_12_FULL_31_6]|nr:MAG: hypothetical protein A3K10_11525 [Bacteroidetes bacterium RIFCSPLOWO2_12_FULL_31_6]
MLSSFKKNIAFFYLIFLIVFLSSCSRDSTTQNSATKKFIKEYKIECDTSDFSNIYENYAENIYIPIKITFNGECRTAKMRIRGDTSREELKKSLKIKFDSLLINSIPKTLNLNAEYTDNTYIRQYLSSKLMQLSGQICYQSEHVKVFINGKFYGLFLQVENIDNDFLKKNNLSKKGNLYKATKDGACLSIFDDFDSKWEKKTNKKSDHNDLTKLIYDINNTPDNKYQDFIKKTFEYDELINLLALNMMLSNSSTYYHNYYLYHDLYTTGKWKILPWDMDKTFSYYNWMPYTYHRTSSEWESDNPLVERAILCKPIFDDIKNRINELHQSHLNNDYIVPLIDSLTSILSEIIPLDTNDNIKSSKEWLQNINSEKSYFDSHYELLQKQFTKQPLSFNVIRFNQIQTDLITFRWQKSEHPNNKKISYILTYGTDFLLADSLSTTVITNISDTFYTLNKILPKGTYYWKITASDGKFLTDGFNTKNIIEVKEGNKLPVVISKNMLLKKVNSPYVVSQNMTINSSITLTIEKGVEIQLKQNVNITCNGNIIANGTPEEPILFTPDNSAEYWGYIFFNEPAKKGYFKNVILKEGTINSQKTELTLDNSSIVINKKPMVIDTNRLDLIYSDHGLVTIKNCTFKSNGFGEGMNLFFGEANIENSFFENIPDAIEYIQMNKGVIRNNLVINSPDDAIDLNACNNILIENNILLYNKDKGISVGTEQYGASINNIQIKNNLIIGNQMAIGIKDSSVAYISNNTLFKNKNGINTYKKREDYSKGGTAYIKNTIFEKNEKNHTYTDKWSSLNVIYSISNNQILVGQGNIKGDPRFIDASRFNFHLKNNSPCKENGENKSDIGAFKSDGTTISLSKIHAKSNTKNSAGDWITITNNYNIPVDLSLYKIVILVGKNQKEFVFPIGTSIERLGKLSIANNYYSYVNMFGTNTIVLGGMPKLSTSATTIQLLNQDGYLLDSFSYSEIQLNKESIIFISDGLNDKKNSSWKIIND